MDASRFVPIITANRISLHSSSRLEPKNMKGSEKIDEIGKSNSQHPNSLAPTNKPYPTNPRKALSFLLISPTVNPLIFAQALFE